ncbi:MAG: hypothetical protein HYX73_04780 [Acidobacteria bacterium]|nr:hypothetical protein [Acidobacteriota bacterium]
MKKRISGRMRFSLVLLMGMLVVTLLAVTPVAEWIQSAVSEEPQNTNSKVEVRSAASIAIGAEVPDKKSPAGAATEGADTKAVGDATTELADQRAALAPEGPAGMRVYVNPSTGQIETPPADVRAAMAAADRAVLDTSSVGLQETPSPVPGGGVLVDLQGRFRIPLVATRSVDGTLTMDHTTVQAGSQEE